jgi:hypothetical protein
MKFRNCKTTTVRIVVSLSVFLLFNHSLEASSSGAFLDRLQGAWQGDGKAFGLPAHLQMKWEWVLGKKFLRLSLKTRTRGSTGQEQTVFEGHAYYRSAGEGKYEGEWFDSRGESFSIKGTVDGESLTALWGAPGKEQGKSVYKFVESDRLEVVDSVRQQDGTWKEFGRFNLSRL